MPSLTNVGSFVSCAAFKSFTSVFWELSPAWRRDAEISVGHQNVSLLTRKFLELCPKCRQSARVCRYDINRLGSSVDDVVCLVQNNELHVIPLATDTLEFVLGEIRSRYSQVRSDLSR